MFFKQKNWEWPLANAVEASLLSDILTQEGIQHKVVRHGEALWGYAEGVAEGYGHLETDPACHDALDQLYRDFMASESPAPDQDEPNA